MSLRRIALFTDGIYPYVMGGMQRHSYYLVKYLTRAGIEVDLYHTPGKGTYDAAKLEFFSPEEKARIHPVLISFPSLPGFPGHYLKESLQYSDAIYRAFLKRRDVDFIYAKGFSAWKLIAEKQKGFECAPVGVKFHGIEMFQKTSSLRSKIESWMLRGPARYNMLHADLVFSYGGKITALIEAIGVKKSRIVEIPSGIGAELITETVSDMNEPKRFVFVGRYEKRKGIRELNNAISILLGRNMAFKMHFIGPVPHSKRLKHANVSYEGPVAESSRIISLLRKSDVLVCPSYSEGMPNVILEAMSQGLAVIATDTGAVNLMVGNDNGWLLPGPQPQGIADAMESALLMREEDLNVKKRFSLQKVQGLTWEKSIQKLISFLEGYRTQD